MLVFTVIIIGFGIFIYSKIEDDLSQSIKKSYEIIKTMSDNDFNSRTPTNIYDKDGNLVKSLKTVDYIFEEDKEKPMFPDFLKTKIGALPQLGRTVDTNLKVFDISEPVEYFNRDIITRVLRKVRTSS